MPIEAIVDSPDFIAMPSAARGILFGLLVHFWLTDCRPLPISDRELRSIGRAHVPTWKHWRGAVLATFEAVRPELEAYKRQRDTKANGLAIAAMRGGAATQTRRVLRALQAAAPPNPATLATPLREAALGPPQPQRDPSQPKRFAQRLR